MIPVLISNTFLNLVQRISISNSIFLVKIVLAKIRTNFTTYGCVAKNIPMVDVDSELLNINRKLSNRSSDEFIPN